MEVSLNKAQQIAVNHKSGPMLVLAGPGSGKTTVIAYRIKFLIMDMGVKPADILVINFTKAASNETKNRCKKLIGDGHHIHIATFHSFFFRILKAHTSVDIANILMDTEKQEVLRVIMQKSGLNYFANDEFIESLENEISLIKNDLLDIRFYNSMVMSTEDFIKVLTLYEDYKKNINKLDFDDMLEKCYTLLAEKKEVLAVWQKKYKYILIDEFQDINTAQYNCMKLLAKEHGNIFAVGDDDQSIYRFRGARPEIMFDFEKAFPKTEKILLDINYRSTDEIISFSENVIKANKNRFPKKIIGTGRKGMKPLIMVSSDVSAEAVNIGRKILSEENTNLKDICVLYRTNTQSRALVDAFMSQHIPFIVRDGGPSVYEHWLTKDICAYLSLALERQNNDSFVRIVNKPNRYVSKIMIADAKKRKQNLLEHLFTFSGMQPWQLSKFEEMMYQLNEIKTKKPHAAIKYIRQIIGYDQYISEYAEYRKMNPKGLMEIMNEISEASKAYENINDFLEHINHAVEETKAHKKNHSNNEYGVTLSTMHGAKGLEFAKVFVASCVEGIIPYKKSKQNEEMEEERRLLYVAVTRAKEELYISIIKSRYEEEVHPSAFLDFCKKIKSVK